MIKLNSYGSIHSLNVGVAENVKTTDSKPFVFSMHKRRDINLGLAYKGMLRKNTQVQAEYSKQDVKTNQNIIEPVVISQEYGSKPFVLPKVFSLARYAAFSYDQGYTQACTAFALCGSFRIKNNVVNKYKGFNPSVMFSYWQIQVALGFFPSDIGGVIKAGYISAQTLGICKEKIWPWNAANVCVPPNDPCYADAPKQKILTYIDVKPLTLGTPDVVLLTIKTRLCQYKTPVVLEVIVMPSFQDLDKTGLVPMPGAGEQSRGNHMVVVIGYDDIRQRFLTKNSWGAWGINNFGFFYLPYAFVSNPALTVGVSWITL